MKALELVRHDTAGKFKGISGWVMFEGYRSQSRQNWLYAEGRTRPGPVVTHVHTSYHSSGLAADCYPVDARGEIIWEPPEAIWEIFGHCARACGLEWGGDFPKLTGGTFVDQPHIQPPLALRVLWKIPAALYVRKIG